MGYFFQVGVKRALYNYDILEMDTFSNTTKMVLGFDQLSVQIVKRQVLDFVLMDILND